LTQQIQKLYTKARDPAWNLAAGRSQDQGYTGRESIGSPPATRHKIHTKGAKTTMYVLHHKRGFTLIELLIVVAIIGILAAIAVPNFMNARIRAKVSRVQADISAIAKAHEMYYLDNNTYPPESEDDIFTGTRVRSSCGLFFLTAPIAYLSSVPSDPFQERAMTSTED